MFFSKFSHSPSGVIYHGGPPPTGRVYHEPVPIHHRIHHTGPIPPTGTPPSGSRSPSQRPGVYPGEHLFLFTSHILSAPSVIVRSLKKLHFVYFTNS